MKTFQTIFLEVICPYAAYPTVQIRINFESPVSQIKGIQKVFPFDWLQDIMLVKKVLKLDRFIDLLGVYVYCFEASSVVGLSSSNISKSFGIQSDKLLHFK